MGSACVSHALVRVPLTSLSALETHHLVTGHDALSSRRDAENSGPDDRAPHFNCIGSRAKWDSVEPALPLQRFPSRLLETVPHPAKVGVRCVTAAEGVGENVL